MRTGLAIVAAVWLLGCGGGSNARTADDVLRLGPGAIHVRAGIERPAGAVNGVVPRAAQEMGLDVERASAGGSPWVLYRGMRLEQGAVLFRVDVAPAPGEPKAATIAVYAEPVSKLILSGETDPKARELAYRIATLALETK